MLKTVIPGISQKAVAWLVFLSFLLLISMPWLIEKAATSAFQNRLERSAMAMAQNLSSRLEVAERNYVRTVAMTRDAESQIEKIAHLWLQETTDVVAVRLMSPAGVVLETWAGSGTTASLNALALQELPVSRIALAHAFELLEPTYSALYKVQDKALVDLFIPIDGARPKMLALTLDTAQWTKLTDAKGTQDVFMQVMPFNHFASDESLNHHWVTLPSWEGLWSLRFESKDPLVFFVSVMKPTLIFLIMVVMALFYLHWRNFQIRQIADLQLLEKSKLLEKQNRLSMLGEMSASLAHEINQPLTSIANYAAAGQLKLQLAHPESDVLPLLQKIQTQTQRAAQVLIAVRSMLHPSPVDARAVDVADLIARLEPHLKWLCSESGVNLHIESKHSAHVHLNAILFEQVLINLIKNSIQALNEIQSAHKNVTVSMASENKLLRLEVIDDGPGIPAGEELRIFESFFTTKVDGLGIGLNLCKSVIERFNGRLTLKSNGASGACFLIELPLASPS